MKIAPLAAVALLAFVSSGCLVSGHSNVERSGTYVSESTMKEIKPGKTDKAWVMAVVGPPTERTVIDREREIWRYAYTETKSSSGSVFLLFGGSDRKVTQGTLFIELTGNIVSRTWRG
jgi:outer membrane protein assembly factor BamE (lipoprotein component of BamABCDE complex)